jgi:hypothetical protein
MDEGNKAEKVLSPAAGAVFAVIHRRNRISDADSGFNPQNNLSDLYGADGKPFLL